MLGGAKPCFVVQGFSRKCLIPSPLYPKDFRTLCWWAVPPSRTPWLPMRPAGPRAWKRQVDGSFGPQCTRRQERECRHLREGEGDLHWSSSTEYHAYFRLIYSKIWQKWLPCKNAHLRHLVKKSRLATKGAWAPKYTHLARKTWAKLPSEWTSALCKRENQQLTFRLHTTPSPPTKAWTTRGCACGRTPVKVGMSEYKYQYLKWKEVSRK